MTLLAYDTPQYTATTGRKKRIPYTAYIESELPFAVSAKKRREDMSLLTYQLSQSEKALGLQEQDVEQQAKALGLQEQGVEQKAKELALAEERLGFERESAEERLGFERESAEERLGFERESAEKSYALSQESMEENKRIALANEDLRREQLKASEEQAQISQGIQGAGLTLGGAHLAHKLGWIGGGGAAVKASAEQVALDELVAQSSLSGAETAGLTTAETAGAETASGAGFTAYAVPIAAAIAAQQVIQHGPEWMADVMGVKEESRLDRAARVMAQRPEDYYFDDMTPEEYLEKFGGPVFPLNKHELAQWAKDEVAKHNASAGYYRMIKASPAYAEALKKYSPEDIKYEISM